MRLSLNADELGEKGQSRFKEICADAKLTCNKSDRDRTGWDFIVEFPFPPTDPNASPDERETHLSCHVQVKTVLEKTDRVELRLSSAEHLAKELKPTFIYVFKVNTSLAFTDAYLIHILDNPLATILRRLRKERSKDLNKRFISLSAKKYGIRLEPTGTALRNALQLAAGPSMSRYIANKSQQLKSLGYGPDRHAVTATLTFDNIDHLVDAFLGLQGNIPASDMSHSTTRFGIKRPVSVGATEALITIRPTPIDTCTITVRADALSLPAVFPGKLLVPPIPNLPREHLKFVFDADLFQVHVSQHKLWLTSSGEPTSLTPRVWSAYWRMLLVMAKGTGTIEIVSDTKPIRTTINIPSKATPLDPMECAHWCRLCDRASAVLTAAGVLEEPNVSMFELHENSDGIASAYALLNPQLAKKPARFTTAYIGHTELPTSLKGLYADFVQLGQVAVGCYGVGSFLGARVGENIEWKAEIIELKRIARLYEFPKEYQEMIESAKSEGGFQVEWFRRPA